MSLIADLKSLDRSQRSAIWASYLGWTLDAFDFFLMVFMLSAIAKEFGTDVKAVAHGVFLTLAARPLGAFVFGLLADRFGRRPILMIDILLFSALEFASGFAPSLLSLLVLRFLFGVAMGGEWGIGSSLAMESIPPKLRGPVSGLLQSGYPSGYLLASGFQMRTKDVMYVANAKVVDYYKLLTLINNTANTTTNTAATAISVNAAVKTRW